MKYVNLKQSYVRSSSCDHNLPGSSLEFELRHVQQHERLPEIFQVVVVLVLEIYRWFPVQRRRLNVSLFYEIRTLLT